MSGRGTSSTRGGRSSSTRHSARGGISKRRNRDVDGDVDMARAGSSSSSSIPSGPRSQRASRHASKMQALERHVAGDSSDGSVRVSRGISGRASRGGRSGAYANLKYLRVGGLKNSSVANNSDGGVAALLDFLERKATAFLSRTEARQVMIKKSRLVGDYVYVGLLPQDVQHVSRLNTYTFASTTLEIVDSPNGDGSSTNNTAVSAHAQETKDKLTAVLGKRYDPATKLLKLDALSQDQALVELGMFQGKERARKVFLALMTICNSLFKSPKEKQDAVQSISLADNGIDDVDQVGSVAETFPHLKNLELSRNQITSIEGLLPWKAKFQYLETIYLAGNPLIEDECDLKREMLKWWPRLRDIDGAEMRTSEQVAEALAALLPKPIPQHGPDFRDSNGIGEAFLLDFFVGFDTDRRGLLNKYYDENSKFSLSVDSNSVRDANAPVPLPWHSYIKFSRNLLKITHLNTRIQRLFKGSSLIGKLWEGLPHTKHPDIKVETTKYIMDCHLLPGLADPSNQSGRGVDGMIISVHGEFEEQDPAKGISGKRSFSRSFILGPGKPGRNPIRVVSDMLCLRANNPLPNVFEPNAPKPIPENNAISVPPQPQQPQQQPSGMSGQAQHQVVLAELSRQTGMTAMYSEMCLSQVEWDLGRALVIFQEKKSQLPPDAFQATMG